MNRLMKRAKSFVVPTLVLAAALAAGVSYREELGAWFRPPPKSAPAPGGHTHAHAAGAAEIAHYTCPMHPSVKQATPGKCPICGMDLVPVSHEDLQKDTLLVDDAKRKRIGVKTERIARRPLRYSIRAVGSVKHDETRLSDVNLRMSGWVKRLRVNQTGQRVAQGQTLFLLYSPELYAAELEHLVALRRLEEGASPLLSGLAESSKRRLLLLGMSEAQVKELEARGEAQEHVPILAAASGYVIQKNVVEGAHVDAGTLVYRIADLSRVWVDAEVYESDLAHIEVGQSANVELPYQPGKAYSGSVDFIYPGLRVETRTARVRVVLKNPELELLPDMYADVRIEADLGERLAVPDSAVVYTGPRRLVFVDKGDGKLAPTSVEIGAHVGGYYEVRGGLADGDVVVTSGNFLIAAESRLRSATSLWETEHGGH